MTFENLLECGFYVEFFNVPKLSLEIDIITSFTTYRYVLHLLVKVNTSELYNYIFQHALLNLKKPIHMNIFLDLINESLEKQNIYPTYFLKASHYKPKHKVK